MPHGSERLRPTQSAESEGLFFATMAPREVQLAETPRLEPISVPRPQPFDTVTIGVVTGRPLKLDFAVTEVKTREVERDDLILGFENGGKVVLKDYMHAFGMLGDQRTTVIQPDGKHYPFTELLAPTSEAKPETPAPGTSPNVLIIQKPAPGETERFKLSAEKPMALNFGMNDIARTQTDTDGNLVVTFKDRAVLVLEGYAALKDSADIALYFAKGDKISLGDLAPGAPPEGDSAEGGHLFTQFAPGGSLGPLDHLGPLGPEPVSLIPPPGPPESPPPFGPPPPEVPPPDIPPPVDCKPPPPKDCEPAGKPVDCRPPPVCEPPPKECAPDGKNHGKDGGKDHHDGRDGGHGKLTWIVAAGIDAGGDVHGEGGRWGGHHARHDSDAAPHRDGGARWVHGHDDAPALQPQHTLAAQFEHAGRGLHGDSDGAEGGWHAQAWQQGRGDHDAAPRGDHGEATSHPGVPYGHQENRGAPVSAQDVFDHGSQAAPAQAGGHGGAHFAAAHDFAAVMAHAESHAPQFQNHAQHNVMGHG
jgi:hypothetical protein